MAELTAHHAHAMADRCTPTAIEGARTICFLIQAMDGGPLSSLGKKYFRTEINSYGNYLE